MRGLFPHQLAALAALAASEAGAPLSVPIRDEIYLMPDLGKSLLGDVPEPAGREYFGRRSKYRPNRTPSRHDETRAKVKAARRANNRRKSK